MNEEDINIVPEQIVFNDHRLHDAMTLYCMILQDTLDILKNEKKDEVVLGEAIRVAKDITFKFLGTSAKEV